MDNITRTQWIAIIMLALGLIAGGANTLTEFFGAGIATKLASAASFLSSFVAGAQIILGGQGQQVLDVKNMLGVQRIEVNAQANQTLAKLAVDPTVDKIAPTLNAQDVVVETAKGNTNA